MKTWRDVRVAAGLTQKDVADALKISPAAWSRKENYKREMKLTEATYLLRKYYDMTNQLLVPGLDIKV